MNSKSTTMAHQHNGHHHHTVSKSLSLAFWLNLLFSGIEIIGGIWTNSTAIIADAFHDFMDAVAIGTAVFLEKLSGKKRTARFSYGYRRFSLLSAIGLSVFLLSGSALMIFTAITSFYEPKEVNGLGMLGLALLGIAINGFAFLKVRKDERHTHNENNTTNHNSKAIMLHLLEDVLGWIAVLIGAIVIYFTGWFWVDGILTLFIAVFIGYNALNNLFGTMKILLQSVPENVNIEALQQELEIIEGIENIHDLHVWSLDGSYSVASVHAVINETETKESVHTAILEVMKKFHIEHPTIQMETVAHSCLFTDC